MRKYCHSKADVPTEPHFAILQLNSVYIPGDERSRTYPGHGYPASTEYHWDYIAFDNEEEWKNEISKLYLRLYLSEYGNKQFVAMRVNPAAVTTDVKVEVV